MRTKGVPSAVPPLFTVKFGALDPRPRHSSGSGLRANGLTRAVLLSACEYLWRFSSAIHPGDLRWAATVASLSLSTPSLVTVDYHLLLLEGGI